MLYNVVLLFCKEINNKSFWFGGHTMSATTTPPYHCSMKAAIDKICK